MAYFGIFSDDRDVFEQFCVKEDVKNDRDIDILIAYYDYEYYEGYAYVLFMKDRELYEVVGSHCSCNGLEYQWEPEKTSWDVIEKYVKENDLPYMCGYEEVNKEDVLSVFKQLVNIKDILLV